MKTSIKILLALFFIQFSVTAQDIDIKKEVEEKGKERNVFSEARYNFFLNTVLIYNEYLDTDNGSFNTTDLRILKPVGKGNWNLRFDLPLISANTDNENKSALGDISAGISFIPFFKNKNGIAFRGRLFVPTALDPNFGSGKWVFAPSFHYGHYFDKNKKLMFLSYIENQFSFAGSSNRSDVNTTIAEAYLFWFIGKNWIAPDLAFRYNATLDGFQNTFALDLGRKFTQNNMAYFHPSVGFGGQKAYNFGIEVGVLILF